jgi:hypothetical protein
VRLVFVTDYMGSPAAVRGEHNGNSWILRLKDVRRHVEMNPESTMGNQLYSIRAILDV